MSQFFLPNNYVSCAEPTYFIDTPSDTTWQPEVHDAVRYLLAATGRSIIVDVGCGNGDKLCGLQGRRIGIDFGANLQACRERHAGEADWIEANLGTANIIAAMPSCDLANAVVVCSDVIEHLLDPTRLLEALSEFARRGAIVITSTPDRVRVRGTDHMGPPSNPSHVREWTMTEYAQMLTASGLDPTFFGYTLNNSADRLPNTIVSISDARMHHPAPKVFSARPLAIIAAYNELDILPEVLDDWLLQGCDVHVIDNWSDDGSWETVNSLARRSPARITIERFPAGGPLPHYEWRKLLARKEEIAWRHQGRWIIHTDADEMRRAPFPWMTMADAFDFATGASCNRIDFTVINFRPTEIDADEASPTRRMTRYRFGTRPGHFNQRKAWFQGRERVDLVSSGGHTAGFHGARDFPYKFLLKHYPIRSHEHGRKKVLIERHDRWSPTEKVELGWHVQYDAFNQSSNFLWTAAETDQWNERSFWQDNGLVVMTDLVRLRLERGWIAEDR